MTESKFIYLMDENILEVKGCEVGSERIEFISDRLRWVLYHSQDCCESVTVNDVVGDPADLIGSEIVFAEEAQSRERIEDEKSADCQSDSFLWTFYRLRTIKGTVSIRWIGESNGYYSESVCFGVEPK